MQTAMDKKGTIFLSISKGICQKSIVNIILMVKIEKCSLWHSCNRQNSRESTQDAPLPLAYTACINNHLWAFREDKLPGGKYSFEEEPLEGRVVQ